MYGHIAIARRLNEALGVNSSKTGPWQWGIVAAVYPTTNTVNVYIEGELTTAVTGIIYPAGLQPAVNDVVLLGRQAGAARSARFVISIYGANPGGGGGGPTFLGT